MIVAQSKVREGDMFYVINCQVDISSLNSFAVTGGVSGCPFVGISSKYLAQRHVI